MTRTQSFMCKPTALLFSAFLTILATSGCGSKITAGSPPNSGSQESISIIAQPASQSIPLGESATFTVSVTGGSSPKYQWSENGKPIAGATSASYITHQVAVADSGSIYTVTVADSTSTTISNPATLTVGPRSPKPGDLRFQLVDSAITAVTPISGVASNVDIGLRQSFTNGYGTPLLFGYGTCFPNVPYDCTWVFSASALPPGITGMNVYYQGGYLSNLSSDLATILTPSTVLTSFDLEPAGQAYGATWLQTSQAGGFDSRQEVVSPSQIQSTANQDGAQSRVITAVSFDASGQANLFSYGWQGDTTTLYETQTVLAAPQDIASSATQLAAEGYIITAFGGDSTNDFVLVGTCVQGDNLPRPIHIQTYSSPAFSPAGWSVVARAD